MLIFLTKIRTVRLCVPNSISEGMVKDKYVPSLKPPTVPTVQDIVSHLIVFHHLSRGLLRAVTASDKQFVLDMVGESLLCENLIVNDRQ